MNKTRGIKALAHGYYRRWQLDRHFFDDIIWRSADFARDAKSIWRIFRVTRSRIFHPYFVCLAAHPSLFHPPLVLILRVFNWRPHSAGRRYANFLLPPSISDATPKSIAWSNLPKMQRHKKSMFTLIFAYMSRTSFFSHFAKSGLIQKRASKYIYSSFFSPEIYICKIQEK